MKHPRDDISMTPSLSLSLGGEHDKEPQHGGGAGAGALPFVCRACRRAFASFQALGGHRASHGRMAATANEAGAGAGRQRDDRRGRGDNLSGVVGIVAASSAVTAVAAGAVSPVMAFGFFVLLLGSLSMVIASIHGT